MSIQSILNSDTFVLGNMSFEVTELRDGTIEIEAYNDHGQCEAFFTYNKNKPYKYSHMIADILDNGISAFEQLLDGVVNPENWDSCLIERAQSAITALKGDTASDDVNEMRLIEITHVSEALADYPVCVHIYDKNVFSDGPTDDTPFKEVEVDSPGDMKALMSNVNSISTIMEGRETNYGFAVYVKDQSSPKPLGCEITILWGEQDVAAKPIKYAFDTDEELKAFVKGIDAMNGWRKYEIIG